MINLVTLGYLSLIISINLTKQKYRDICKSEIKSERKNKLPQLVFLKSSLTMFCCKSLIFNLPVIVHIDLFFSIGQMIWAVVIKNGNHFPFMAVKVIISDIRPKVKLRLKLSDDFTFVLLFIIDWTNWDDLSANVILVYSPVEIVFASYFGYVLLNLPVIASL
jgi:hypothetical protein